MSQFVDPSDVFIAYASSYAVFRTSSDTENGPQLSNKSSEGTSPSLHFRTLNGANPTPGDVVEIWRDNRDGSYTFIRSVDYVGSASRVILGSVVYNPIFRNSDGTYEIYGQTGPDPLPYNASIFCFLGGTLVATPEGEVPVESLAIGDLISTAEGGVRKVLWVGKQAVSSVFGPTSNFPVEISIDALGENLPRRPLRVSPGHSLLVDGAFPIASALINGSTVRQLTREELPETFTYYHIEVEDHALILAEGVPAETFLDAWSRRTFDNWPEYVALYGEEERAVPPSDLHFRRVLNFEALPESLKDRLGEPLPEVARRAA